MVFCGPKPLPYPPLLFRIPFVRHASKWVWTLVRIINTKIMKSLGKFFSWFVFVCFSCCTYLLNSNPQVQKSYPYLTTDCFLHNWAIADMVKGYITGTRKEHHRQ